MTDDRYLVGGTHPDTLSSGRPIAPGETVPDDAVNPADPHDAELLASGTLIDVAEVVADAERHDAEHPPETPDNQSSTTAAPAPQEPGKQATAGGKATGSSGPDSTKES